ncbi:MAG TPA: adenylate/guanylate cyclase domain-containing protein [Chthoniobacterales bacterium]
MMSRGFRSPDYLATIWPFAFTLIAASVLWLFLFGNPLEIVELRWLGQLLRWRAAAGIAPAVDSRIVHLDIDQHDIEKLATIGLEYDTAATIIREAAALRAKVVVFDIIFSRGSEAESQPVLDAISNARKSGTHVVLAEALEPRSAGDRVLESIRSFPFAERLADPTGLINTQSDDDGVLRRYALVQRGPQGFEPSLALAAYLSWRGLNWKDVEVLSSGIVQWPELGPDDKTLVSRRIEVDPVLLNFRVPWSFRTENLNALKSVFVHYRLDQLRQAYADAQKPQSPIRSVDRTLDDCVLIVSYIVTGVGDVGTTPMGKNEPGVVAHMEALEDLIQNSFLHRVSRFSDALFLMGLLVLVYVMSRCGGIISLVSVWICGVLVIIVFGACLLIATNSVYSVFYISGLWTSINVAEVARRYIREFVERLKLRATMSLYFSPRVLERVLKNPGSTEPQEAQLTLLLTDLRNSTPLAERLGAKDFFNLLNRVFEIQTRAVSAEDGNLEHFLGDQFLSYWGAPNPQPDGADRALRAAVLLLAEMESCHESLEGEIRRLFGYGVALHSGSALVGNKGSRLRMDYGIVGDLVNTAARVESLTKFYGVRLLVTRDTFARLTAPPRSRLLDNVIVKWKNAPIEILEIDHPPGRPNFGLVAQKYAEAFECYRAGRFENAERLFAALAESEGDLPSVVLKDRCALLRVSPPENWDGVFRLENK